MKKKILILGFLFFAVEVLFAQQSKIDSFLILLKTDKEDTNKVIHLVNVCNEYRLIGEFDTALQYGNAAFQLASVLLSEAKNLAVKQAARKGIASSYNTIGTIYYAQGNYGRSLENFLASLKIRQEIGNKKTVAQTYNNIGNVYDSQGNYDKALENHFASLKIKEEIGDKQGISSSYNNIGNIYSNQGNYDKALENHTASLKIRQEIGDKHDIAASYNNIGIIYINRGNYDKALENYFASLKLRKEIGDKQGIASSYNNIGNVFNIQSNYDKALENHIASLKIKQEIGDQQGIAMSYNNIGNLYLKQKKIAEAKKQQLLAISISKEIGAKDQMMYAYSSLSQCDSVAGNWKGAYEYHQLSSQMKDSLFNEESNKQIAEMQTKYDTEKKEQQIKLLSKDKEIQMKDLQRQKAIRNAVAGGLILVLLFSFVLINRFLLIRKQKKIIEVEREKSEKLLLNILPKETADELKLNNSVKPKFYEQVTVMFTDFKGFTTIAEKMTAEELVSELDFIFKKFDEIISKYPIEKIKTIGDAYMCAGGLPVANTTNPIDVVRAALEIQEWMKSQNKWQLRLGIHTGSVIAGVVGDKKFAYDIWGDTVNIASRMESSGEAGKVNISGKTYDFIRNHFECIYRGEIEAKNKGKIKMYFVEKTI